MVRRAAHGSLSHETNPQRPTINYYDPINYFTLCTTAHVQGPRGG